MMQPPKDRLGSHIAAGSSTRLCRQCTGRTLAQNPMRPPLIVIQPPCFDLLLRVFNGKKLTDVQTLIPQSTVK